ncbi:ankyrin repeat-containing domain protein [Penicillium malachiteum]|uniref:Ankyrin repeat-containing domain protein n=1 Tax=Penicillium malachiteum TaxID=1324776 RepID=A0AAD6HAJ8_9EURO|nr:ankyrin repeat-containing domain protein [Penicillium malachiteum]
MSRSLITLPPELLLLIAAATPEGDHFSLLQVNHLLYDLLLPSLYRRHIHKSKDKAIKSKDQVGLFRAVAAGNERGTLHFLRYGANVNSVTGPYTINEPRPWYHPLTPLNIAANMGNDTLLKILRDHGAEINGVHPNNLAWTKRTGVYFTQPPVLDALLSEHVSTARLLLEWGSLIESPRIYHGGLVNWALEKAQIEMLELLVEFGLDFNVAVFEKPLPLFQVATASHISTDVVRCLLDHGADITLVDDEHGKLLRGVIKHGNIDTARLLLERGAKHPPKILDYAIIACTFETIDLLAEYGIRLHDINLMQVINAGRLDILQLLIEEGYDLNKRYFGGNTALHHAVHFSKYFLSTQRGMAPHIRHRHPVRVLLRQVEMAPQLNVSARCSVWGYFDHAAIEILLCLIKGGADINAVDGKGRTPMDVACKWAPLVVQQLLVDNGADWKGGELPGDPIYDSPE